MISSVIFKLTEREPSKNMTDDSPSGDVVYVFAFGATMALVSAAFSMRVPLTRSEKDYVDSLSGQKRHRRIER